MYIYMLVRGAPVSSVAALRRPAASDGAEAVTKAGVTSRHVTSRHQHTHTNSSLHTHVIQITSRPVH